MRIYRILAGASIVLALMGVAYVAHSAGNDNASDGEVLAITGEEAGTTVSLSSRGGHLGQASPERHSVDLPGAQFVATIEIEGVGLAESELATSSGTGTATFAALDLGGAVFQVPVTELGFKLDRIRHGGHLLLGPIQIEGQAYCVPDAELHLDMTREGDSVDSAKYAVSACKGAPSLYRLLGRDRALHGAFGLRPASGMLGARHFTRTEVLGDFVALPWESGGTESFKLSLDGQHLKLITPATPLQFPQFREIAVELGGELSVTIQCERRPGAAYLNCQALPVGGAADRNIQPVVRRVSYSDWERISSGWQTEILLRGLSRGNYLAELATSSESTSAIDSAFVEILDGTRMKCLLRCPSGALPVPLKSEVTIRFFEPIVALDDACKERLVGSIRPMSDGQVLAGQLPQRQWTISDPEHLSDDGFSSTWSPSPYGLIPGNYCVSIPAIGFSKTIFVDELNRLHDLVIEDVVRASVEIQSGGEPVVGNFSFALQPTDCLPPSPFRSGHQGQGGVWQFCLVPGNYQTLVMPARVSVSVRELEINAGQELYVLEGVTLDRVPVRFGSPSNPTRLPIDVLSTMVLEIDGRLVETPSFGTLDVELASMTAGGVEVILSEWNRFTLSVIESNFISPCSIEVAKPSVDDLWLDVISRSTADLRED